jgi:hypothetical protein
VLTFWPYVWQLDPGHTYDEHLVLALKTGCDRSPCRCFPTSTRECSKVTYFQLASNDRPWPFNTCHTLIHILQFASSFSSNRNSSSSLDTFSWFWGGWSISSNEPHLWSCGEARSPLGPQGDPWTTQLPRSLVGNTVLHLAPTFIGCAPF